MPERLPFDSEMDAGRESALLQIQSALGVTRDDALDFIGVQVACPDPRGEGAQMALGDYMNSEHGAGHTDQLLDTARQAKEMGASPEQSLRFALGMAAVVDKDTGRLARVIRSEESPAPGSKKK